MYNINNNTNIEIILSLNYFSFVVYIYIYIYIYLFLLKNIRILYTCIYTQKAPCVYAASWYTTSVHTL